MLMVIVLKRYGSSFILMVMIIEGEKKKYWNIGKLSFKKNGKKRGHCPLVGGGANPSSFFKPKFTGFSNHSEMDF